MKRILAYRELVARELHHVIRQQIKDDDSGIGWGKDFFGRLEPFAAGGKLLRGCLVCFAYESFGGQAPDTAVVKAATAIELAHSGLLIHDDVMDRDDIRRGQPSMHSQYEQLGLTQNLAGSERFGDSLAVCGGDAALLLAFKLMNEVQATNRNKTAGRLFASQLLQVCAGQMQDVFFDAKPELPAKADIMRLMRSKTAAYTVALPLSLGAALAGQSLSVIRQLQAFGEAAGSIYQIRDDELGLIGDQSVTGKTTGSDIRQHKKTLIYYYLCKHVSASERTKLTASFEKPSISPDDIADIRTLAQRHNISQLLAEDMDRLKRNAGASLSRIKSSASTRTELIELLDFCAARSH